MEQTHSSRVAASTSPCSTYISFFSSPSELARPESLPPWTLSDSDSRASPAGSPSADFAAHGESLGDRHLRTLQISYEAVSEGALVSALVNGPCLSRVLEKTRSLLGRSVTRGLAPGMGELELARHLRRGCVERSALRSLSRVNAARWTALRRAGRYGPSQNELERRGGPPRAAPQGRVHSAVAQGHLAKRSAQRKLIHKTTASQRENVGKRSLWPSARAGPFARGFSLRGQRLGSRTFPLIRKVQSRAAEEQIPLGETR